MFGKLISIIVVATILALAALILRLLRVFVSSSYTRYAPFWSFSVLVLLGLLGNGCC